ncbi:NADH dehydrogenase subunit L [Spirosomataceae bacterium TFI 002]|nr:NADH dehydrogenase subunit L [Spirosomataceae bacterium TFI 002]
MLAFRKMENKRTAIFRSILLNSLGLAMVFYFANSTLSTAKLPWLTIGSTQIDFDIYLDNATWLMLGLVQFISLGVQLFSIKYMEKDSRITTYYAFLNLFIGSMLGLVISGNLLFAFLFWELVGFCSYLLIGFWFDKQSATEAASKAFMVNKVGDSFLLISIGLIYAATGTFEIEAIHTAIIQNPTLGLIPIASFMLFLGSLAKSAQLPLQVWLPDAMEGPTPVSALIHAATMVAAGIFLLARLDFLLTDFTLVCIATIGALTAFLAGYSAVFQWDIKKILAYSTISQLGMMMVAIGIGQSDAALFHLFTHAFFKAALFLIAGALIYYVHHEQDIRKLSEITTSKAFLKIAFLICGASLAGFPLFSGFLSKEVILLSTLEWDSGNTAIDFLIPSLFVVSSLFTVVYLSKIGYYVFFKNKQKGTSHWSTMEVIIAILTILSLALPHSFDLLDATNSTFASYFNIPTTHHHTFGWMVVLVSIALAIMSFLHFKKEKPVSDSIWVKIGFNHFYIDYFITNIISKSITGSRSDESQSKLFKNGLSGLAYKFDSIVLDGFVNAIAYLSVQLAAITAWFDRKVVDGIVNGVSYQINKIGDRLRRLQSGKLQEYLIATVLILIFTVLVATIL